MGSVEDILARYIEDFQSGEAESPVPYLEMVDETYRQELAAAMDTYLMTAPRREWDAAAYEASQAGRIADRLWRSLDGASGEWPVLLPRLRERQRLTRRSVTERLAAWLDAPADDPRVASYYHEMEQGLLPWRGVSVEELTLAARRGGDVPPPPTTEAAMARVGAPDPRYASDLDAPGSPGEPSMQSPPIDKPSGEWDEIDRAFLGGSE